ncbi:hypothetical protein SAMN05444678_103309 [Sphingomonas sp. YR710]|nr:hypothetical protein [Sphingomonas sp. YR710]SDC53949.1 hypothetical protein SAMN05444678_103309 [Sphingomonas sp. YR710]
MTELVTKTDLSMAIDHQTLHLTVRLGSLIIVSQKHPTGRSSTLTRAAF